MRRKQLTPPQVCSLQVAGHFHEQQWWKSADSSYSAVQLQLRVTTHVFQIMSLMYITIQELAVGEFTLHEYNWLLITLLSLKINYSWLIPLFCIVFGIKHECSKPDSKQCSQLGLKWYLIVSLNNQLSMKISITVNLENNMVFKQNGVQT